MNGVQIRRLDAARADFEASLDRLLGRQVAVAAEVERTVAEIIERVARDGDAAVLEYTRRFDRREITDAAGLELDRQQLDDAMDSLEPALAAAMTTAAARIRRFHESQLQKDFHIEDEFGNRLGQRITPMERVGLYVPGGRAAYPSSVLMTAIPARVAGVEELIMVVPAPDGYLHPPVLAAAGLAGVDRVFTIGGAQAVAALAVGTATVPRVDKIVGPGNVYVATAKKQVFGRVGIDMIAGPSEVLILADDSADPLWVVMDLFAQAEHDELAQSILVTTSVELADAVTAMIGELLPTMQRARIIARALADHGAVVVAPDLGEAARIANRIAPEHLELLVEDPDEMLPLIRHAGAIFVGAYSAEVMGDYCAGPNHVLPTSGTARFSSPLGVYDFQKRSSVIHLSPAGSASIAQTAAVLADSEGLEAHARSARLRAGETR